MLLLIKPERIPVRVQVVPKIQDAKMAGVGMRRYAHRTSVVEYLAKTRRTENSFFFLPPKKVEEVRKKVHHGALCATQKVRAGACINAICQSRWGWL